LCETASGHFHFSILPPPHKLIRHQQNNNAHSAIASKNKQDNERQHGFGNEQKRWRRCEAVSPALRECGADNSSGDHSKSIATTAISVVSSSSAADQWGPEGQRYVCIEFMMMSNQSVSQSVSPAAALFY
jgi:hypothetical protein